MIKKELIRKTASNTNFTRNDVETILNEILDQIKGELKNGGNVNINQFGKFYVTEYPSREIITPQGDSVKTEASTVPRFKATKHFKDQCNNRLP